MADVAELCPAYVGERRIALALRSFGEFQEVPRVGQVVDVSVNYADAEPQGIVLPIDLIVAGPGDRQRRTFSRFAPASVSFIPRSVGRYVVTLGERHHNRWFGSLEVTVL